MTRSGGVFPFSPFLPSCNLRTHLQVVNRATPPNSDLLVQRLPLFKEGVVLDVAQLSMGLEDSPFLSFAYIM